MKVLISDNVAKECVDILSAADGIEVDFKTDYTPEELEKAIGNYDGLIVRSATKVRENILDAAHKLKVIGRAGAGVDNIDIGKATDKGVIVMNTPGGNTVSTAEHTFSMMMALSRNIPQGDRSIKEGRWDRKKYTGVEVRGKTLGIIGLGNIGRTLAKRARAFEMDVIGYDPFISKEMAESIGIELVELEDMWGRADYISVHTPLNEKTKHIVGKNSLAKCKDGVRIINCARGGVVDEKALLEAIESGKVAGAALDVYEDEPPKDNPLVMHEKVVSTPHLGASTTEAQDIVAVMVGEQVRDFLLSGEVRNAVNVPSISPKVYEKVKPFMDLGSNLGQLLGHLGEGQLKEVDITYFGNTHEYDTWPMTSAVLQGIFSRGISEDVNIVNAIKTAEKLGISLNELKSSEVMDYKNSIKVEIVTEKDTLSVVGTIFGKNQQRIVSFQGYELDFIPEGNIIICGNTDRPGIIGDIGSLLANKEINISHMTWARKAKAGEAIVVLNTDQEITNEKLGKVRDIKGVTWANFLKL